MFCERTNGNPQIKYLFFAIILAITLQACADVSLIEKDGHVIIQNQFVRVDFDLQKGTYTGSSIEDNTTFFSDARFQLDPGLGQWKMPATVYRFEHSRVNDEFGRGKGLKIYHQPKKSYDPERILLITLYDNKPFIVIGWGINNRFDYPVRVKRVDLMHSAKLFDGQTVENPKSSSRRSRS